MTLNDINRSTIEASSFGLSLLLVVVFFVLVSVGQRGGDTFFSNLYLTIPFLGVVISGLIAGALSMYSLVKHSNTSFFGVIKIIYGAVIAIFLIGEIVFPHA